MYLNNDSCLNTNVIASEHKYILLLMIFFLAMFFFYSSFTLKSGRIPLWCFQLITRNNDCKSIVCFTGLIVRLQSDPQSEQGHYNHRKCCAFAHWKQKGAADLTKQTRTTAGLTTVYLPTRDNFFPQCFIKNVISDYRYQTTLRVHKGWPHSRNVLWKMV